MKYFVENAEVIMNQESKFDLLFFAFAIPISSNIYGNDENH